MSNVNEGDALGEGPAPQAVLEGVLVDEGDVLHSAEVRLLPPAFGTGDRRVVLHVDAGERSVDLMTSFEDLARWVDRVRESHAVSAADRRKNATAAAWARVRMLDEAEASARLGRPAHLEHQAGRLLARTTPDGQRYPAAQFTSDGRVSDAVPRLRALAAEHDWSEGDLVLWLYSPSRSIPDEAAPVTILHHDPDAVVAAFDQHARIVS